MRRILFGAAVLALLGLLVDVHLGRAQEKLKTAGYGSLSGKVTLAGKVPDVVDLVPKMKLHADGPACCLAKDAKAIEKIDQTWVVDPKTKAVKNVVVWVMPPKDTYFEIPFKFKRRKEKIVIDQPHCAFLPRVSLYNPSYFDGKEMVPTGQELIVKNSATVSHNVRAIGSPKVTDGFNRNLPPGTELNVTKDLKGNQELKPQLLPVSIQCDVHTWMAAKLFVFDHPYYAISDEKGDFTIPQVPAGAVIRLMAYHEGVGWVNQGFKAGQAIKIQKGKNTELNLEVKAP
jgi:hypothetical protein